MISIRPMTRSNDPAEAFVYDAWARSLYGALTTDGDRTLTGFLASRLPNAGCCRPYVARVIEQSRVFIAQAEDAAPPLLLGFVCAEPHRVHYVYVKKNVRERGLARQLLEHAQRELGDFTYTSTTHAWARKLGLAYDPIIERERKSA